MKIGFIGIGNMGSRMVSRFADKYGSVHVYDTDKTKISELGSKKFISCASPQEVGDKAELVFLSLPTGGIVLRVIEGESGLAKGKAVRTLKVATGVPGADTPLGDFNVQYKMPKARFQGTNVTGVQYDIPDVNWVLAFMDDYTIHGSYWRNGFGAPASNGCVSLSDDDAKIVFDWAPEGTRIKIHQ